MTHEEVRFQVAVSCIQGVLEAKLGAIGEIAPAIAVRESLRIADEFVKQWFGEGELVVIERKALDEIKEALKYTPSAKELLEKL